MMGQDWEDGFRAGDPDVFKELVTRESPRLLGYALRLTGDRATAEDLVQDVWVHAYRARRSYTGAGPLMAWLLAICRRQAWDYRRREQRQLSLSVGLSQRAEQDRESASPADAAGAAEQMAKIRGEDIVASVDGVLRVANKMGEADLVFPGRPAQLAAVTIRDPEVGTPVAEEVGDDRLATRGLGDEHRAVLVMEHPQPPILLADAQAGLVGLERGSR